MTLALTAAAERLRRPPGRPRTRPKRSPGPAVAVDIAPRLVDVAGAAAYLSVSTWTVRDLLAVGTLKRVAIPLGQRDVRRVLLDRQDLDELIGRWKEAGSA